MAGFVSLRWLLCLCVHLRTCSGMLLAREDSASLRPDEAQDPTNPDRHKGLETIEINLDLPPRERFKFLARKYRNWYRSLTERRLENIKKMDPAFLDEIVANMHLEDEYREEIEGFLEEIGDPRCTLRLSLIGQMKYELGYTQHFECTGILAAMKNGTVIQGRNMDMDSGTVPFKVGEGVFRAVFTRGGKPFLEGPFAVGGFALSTGLRYGGWSVSQNTRNTGARSQAAWNQELLASTKKGGRVFGWVVRRLLETVPDFDTAVQELANAKYMAPHYFILAGAKPYQAAVVTAGHVGMSANVRLLRNEPGHWFLVQTNDDHWKQPLDIRRDAAITSMKKKGRKRIPYNSVWESLRSFPVCNPNTWWTWQAIPALNTTSFTQEPCNF